MLQGASPLGARPINVSKYKPVECCGLISPGAVGLVEQNVVFSVEISKRGYVLENGRIVIEGEGKELLLDEHIKKAYLAI